jgi:cytochrome P450
MFVSVMILHNDPKYYPDPKSFDPERFRDGGELEEEALRRGSQGMHRLMPPCADFRLLSLETTN